MCITSASLCQSGIEAVLKLTFLSQNLTFLAVFLLLGIAICDKFVYGI